MRVVYFNRAQGDRFSIEKVTRILINEISKTCDVESYSVPELRADLLSLIKNILYVYKRRSKDGINHITGDIHYCILGLIGVKSVLTIHDTVFLEVKQSKLARFAKWLFWLYIPCLIADKVICISEKTKDELKKHHINTAHVKVIYDPVDLAIYKKDICKESKINIIHVGTKDNKNLFRVIKSLRGLKCKLIIVGPLSHEIIESLKDNDIDYSNYVNVSDENLSELYAKSDIVSFPSLYEGFGMPIIEGQLSGCVVLTSNIPPMSEVGGDSVYYIDPYDIESMHNGFRELIDNQQLRMDLLSKGYENSLRFSADSICREYMNVYKEL